MWLIEYDQPPMKERRIAQMPTRTEAQAREMFKTVMLSARILSVRQVSNESEGGDEQR